MGLFRNRRKKDRGKTAADLHQEQPSQERSLHGDSPQEESPQQESPQQQSRFELAGPAVADPGAGRREVAAERRPNPDQPGWGRALGQELGRARESRPGQD
jgi:hypothetical protein